MLELSLASYLAAAGEEGLNCETSHYQVPTSVLSHLGGTLSNYHLEYSVNISSHPCSPVPGYPDPEKAAGQSRSGGVRAAASY